MKVAVPKSHYIIEGFNQLVEGFIPQGETMSKNHSTNHIGDSMHNGEGRVHSFSCRQRKTLISKALPSHPLLFG